MKASELIKHLQDGVERYGDIDVCINIVNNPVPASDITYKISDSVIYGFGYDFESNTLCVVKSFVLTYGFGYDHSVVKFVLMNACCGIFEYEKN